MADPIDPKDADQTPGPDAGPKDPKLESQNTDAPPAEPKMFPQEAMTAVREEAKKYRLEKLALQKEIEELKAKQEMFEANMKKALGLSGDDGEEDLVARAEKKAAESEKRAKGALLRASFKEAAVAAKFHDPDTAFKLLDADGIEVNLETSEVTGVKEAVEKMAEEKTWLIQADNNDKPPDLTLGGANPQSGGAGGGTRTEEYERRKGELMEKQKDPVARSTALLALKRELGIK